MEVLLSDILSYFRHHNYQIVAPKQVFDAKIIGPKSIKNATKENISFLGNKFENEAEALISESAASLIIVEKKLFLQLKNSVSNNSYLIISDDAKKTILDCLNIFFKIEFTHCIHPSAIIGTNVHLGKNVNIGPFAVIEDGVQIGDNTFIDAHVHIKTDCKLGKNIIIKSHTTIGNWGFGFVKNAEGQYENFPHFGTVSLEDDVQIGSNCCIDRGTLGDTLIKKGVRIDNLVHIAHNVEVGENTLIIANSLIGGSVVIGDNCWISPSVTVRNALKIGNNVLVGMASVVTKNLAANEQYAGVPAMPLEAYKELLQMQKQLINKK